MANRLFPVRHVPRSTQLWHELEGESIPWPHTPRFGWECLIGHLDLVGANATQRIVLTIDSTDFVTGRARAVITGGGLVSAVTVTADAAVADDEEAASAALAAAITALIPTTLAGVVVSAAEASNTVAIICATGIGRVSIDFTYEPAQQISVTWGGTLVDGEYSVTISAGQGFDDVTIPNNRAGGSPANAAAMAAAFETTAEGLIATTLADVLVSADDVGAVNTLIMEPGIDATVTATVTVNRVVTFAGTATDGDYSFRISHATLPGGSLDVTTTRAAASPATNTDLADALEADLEARALLSQLLVNANNTAGANTLTFFPGVSSLFVTSLAAPAPGTLTVTAPSVTIDDVTPAGPVVSTEHFVTLDLSSIAFDGAFPGNVRRQWCFCSVITAFGAGRTITVGDVGEPAGVLGSTPVTLNTVARSCSAAADSEYQPRPELAWVPTATIALGSSSIVSAGSVLVEILFTPNLAIVAAA